MKRHFVDAAFHRTHDLAGRTVGILMARKKIGQVIVPEIPLKPMTDRHLQDPVDAFIQ